MVSSKTSKSKSIFKHKRKKTVKSAFTPQKTSITRQKFRISYLPSVAPSTTLRATTYSGQAKEAYLAKVNLF